jgi:hypothetical protein
VGKGDQVGKIEVECEKDARLSDRLRKNLAVWRSLETFVAKMDTIVPLRTKPLDDANVHAHIGEETHGR